MKELFIVNVHTPFKLSKPMSWIALAIRKATQSYWNHTGLLAIDRNDNLYVVEMGPKGIQKKVDYSNWAEDKIITIARPNFKYSKRQAKTIIDLTVELKLKYDFRGTLWYQLIYAIGKFINRKLGTHIKWMGFTNAGKAAQKFYCSEYVGWIWHKLSGMFSKWYRLSPDDIISELANKFVIIYHGDAKLLKYNNLNYWFNDINNN